MALWVPFLFGIGLGALIGFLLGRQRRPGPLATPAPTPRVAASTNPVTHVALDERSANVLNALNNRLAAIGALTDLLSGSALDPERARALASLHGEVRRAAEITDHFLELAEHPQGATEPSDRRGPSPSPQPGRMGCGPAGAAAAPRSTTPCPAASSAPPRSCAPSRRCSRTCASWWSTTMP